jgi:hypothetical protein
MTASPGDKHDLERVLGHEVQAVLPPASGGNAWVAVSVTGEPARVRAAWVAPGGKVVARLGCPPGVPSAARPVTATICDVSADGVSDRVVLGLVAQGVAGATASMTEPGAVALQVHGGRVLAGRVPSGPMLVAIDAVAQDGEAIGRLMHAGVNEMALVAGRVEGRLGASHGMAAGFGAGATVSDLATAELEAGFTAMLPAWLPAEFSLTTVRVEPEAAYPFAPPSIAVAWSPRDSDARVLLRQGPAPLAVPELPDGRGSAVDIGGVQGVLRARGMAFLVWERGDRAFGLQVRGTEDPPADALRVAASISPMP